MIRDIIDQLMSSKITPLLVLLAFCGAMVWALILQRGKTPAALVNATLAAATVLYITTDPSILAWGFDAQVALGLLEIGVFVVMATALSGAGVPAWLFWMSFGVNMLLIAAFTVFAFTFKIAKLF
jgi:hypothetical protein